MVNFPDTLKLSVTFGHLRIFIINCIRPSYGDIADGSQPLSMEETIYVSAGTLGPTSAVYG